MWGIFIYCTKKKNYFNSNNLGICSVIIYFACYFLVYCSIKYYKKWKYFWLIYFHFDYYCKRCHRNKNISQVNLLSVTFDYYNERCLLIGVVYKFKGIKPKYLFLWDIFLAINRFKKRVYRNARKFFACDFMEIVLGKSISIIQ